MRPPPPPPSRPGRPPPGRSTTAYGRSAHRVPRFSQNGDGVSEIEHGQLTPSGQWVLTLEFDEQGATKADVAALTEQLRRIERALAARG